MASSGQNLETYTSNFSDSTAVGTPDEIGMLGDSTGAVHNGGETQGLPKGAMSVPMLPYRPPPIPISGPSPPSTPSQRLLDAAESPNRVQFASYRDEKSSKPLVDDSNHNTWTPLPLRTYFWLPFVAILVLGAVGLEVALAVSKKRLGWATSENPGNSVGVMHYVYTLPPVAVVAVLVAMWAWTDIEIKKMQPYVDLVHGDSPPHRSLLLDYTRTNNFYVWTRAAGNKHYLVALASLMVLLSLTFQPLAAALLVVKPTYFTDPLITRTSLFTIGLNNNTQTSDLTSFLTASGYASASVLYNLTDPPFVHNGYTVAPFDLPRDIVGNGTVFANTTAVKSDPGCQPVDVTMTNHTDGSGWTNNATFNGCSISWEVDHNATSLFGTDTPDCGTSTPASLGPVVFWFFTYDPVAAASATFCFPSISLWDVAVTVDIASGNLSQVTQLGPFNQPNNITGAPLNGRVYNGINFDFLVNPDRFVLGRANATQLQMPAAVFQSAVQSAQGLVGSFEANRFVGLSSSVYSTYLALIAKTVYFLPASEPIQLEIKTFRNRLWLTPTAVHLLAVALLLLAFFATIIHLFHRSDRRNLHLQHEPGTIASAVSIGAQTSIGELLAGRQRAEDISQVLKDRKFRIDPDTNRIVMEGEEGYEYARSPGFTERRRSVFAALQARSSRRFSRPPSVPGSPLPT